MSITAAQEQRFYDSVCGRSRDIPDADLAVDRAVMRRTLNDPHQPVYERRRPLQLARPRAASGMRSVGLGRVDGMPKAPPRCSICRPWPWNWGFAALVPSEWPIWWTALPASCFADGAAVYHTLKHAHAFEVLARVIRTGNKPLLNPARQARKVAG